jgi:hypothetical protein
VLQIGGGAGGSNGPIVGNGQGGKACSAWFTYTWTRGGEVPLATTSLTVVVGAGGAAAQGAGAASSINGTGLVWTFEYGGTSYPNNPGPIASSYGTGGMGLVNVAGGNAPDSTALNGVVYPGGKGGTTLGSVGGNPGGGGAGGASNSPGGKGGSGAVYIYAF